MQAPGFSIITVNYNNSTLLISVLERTLETLKSHSFEVIVVDNGSTDGSLNTLTSHYADHPIVTVIDSGKNGGFGYGCNAGARKAKAPVLWFLNSDAWVLSAAGLEQSIALTQDRDTGMVGTSVLLEDATASPQGGSDMSFSFFLLSAFRPGAMFRKLPEPVRNALQKLLRYFPGSFGRYSKSYEHHTVNQAYVSRGVGGASFLIRASVYKQLHGFDESFFLYDEDADLCLRCIDMKLVNLVEPRVQVLTFPSATTSRVPSMRLKRIKRASRLRLIKKHFRGVQKALLNFTTRITWYLL
jgi:GT2 family glycosyltransferase